MVTPLGSDGGWPEVSFGEGRLLSENDFGNGYAMLVYPGYLWLVRTADRTGVARVTLPGSPTKRPTPEEFAEASSEVAVAMLEDMTGGPVEEGLGSWVDAEVLRHARAREGETGPKPPSGDV